MEKINLRNVTVAVVADALVALKGKAAEMYKRADLTEVEVMYYRAVTMALRFTAFLEKGNKRADALKMATAELPEARREGKTPYNILALGLDILKFNLTAADVNGKARYIVNNRPALKDIPREERTLYLNTVEGLVTAEATAKENAKAARAPKAAPSEANPEGNVRRAVPADVVVALETYAGREKFAGLVTGLGLAADSPAADILNAILAAALKTVEARKAAEAIRAAKGKGKTAAA